MRTLALAVLLVALGVTCIRPTPTAPPTGATIFNETPRTLDVFLMSLDSFGEPNGVRRLARALPAFGQRRVQFPPDFLRRTAAGLCAHIAIVDAETRESLGANPCAIVREGTLENEVHINASGP